MPLFDVVVNFVNSSALYSTELLSGFGREEAETESDTGRVRLMTLHASKGLEFSHVFIIGVNYGLIPLRVKRMEEEDEERRLFFVGLTRAKDYLELSWYTNPDYFGAVPGESKYLHMIPERLIEKTEEESARVDLQELRKQVQILKEEKREISEKWEIPEKREIPENREISERQEIPYNWEIPQNREPHDNHTPQEIPETITPEEVLRLQPDHPGAEAGSRGDSHRKVSHRKYGTGTVIAEDEVMITVDFPGYGAKEFMKAFSELTQL